MKWLAASVFTVSQSALVPHLWHSHVSRQTVKALTVTIRSLVAMETASVSWWDNESSSHKERLNHHQKLCTWDDRHRVQLDAAEKVHVRPVTVDCLPYLHHSIFPSPSALWIFIHSVGEIPQSLGTKTERSSSLATYNTWHNPTLITAADEKWPNDWPYQIMQSPSVIHTCRPQPMRCL